jgi:hypothetical protein
MALLAPFAVDGTLRVLAQTRILLLLNVVRLAIIVAMMQWALEYGLVSATLVIVLANVVFKVAALARIKSLLGVTVLELLPWRRLAAFLTMAIAAGLIAWGIKYQLSTLTIPFQVLIATASGCAAYGTLLWSLDVLRESEKLVFRNSVARIKAFAALRFQ